jgi:hypothetical protein
MRDTVGWDECTCKSPFERKRLNQNSPPKPEALGRILL